MIFEKGWFLHKMNKHAPRGYKFVAIGDEGRIAMYAPEFMGNRSPMGPFLSCFSFDLLDNVYGGLMTRRSSHMSQGALPIDYIYSYELTRPQNVSPDAKYEIYRSVAAQHMRTYCRPHPIMIRKNAILVQGMLDKNAYLPDFLHSRVKDYVNKCVWYAIERVFSSMMICDMKYYQSEYRKKMDELGIEYGRKFGILDIEKKTFEKRYAELTARIEELQYDILPRQEKSLERAISREATPEKQQNLQKQLDASKTKLSEFTREKQSLEPTMYDSPAQHMLPGVFFDHGTPVIPKLPRNKVMQMLQLLCMRETKLKNK